MRKVKITKEQYDRIFKSGLLNEAAEPKKEKPSYGTSDPIEKETKELISYFYRHSADLSPFWEEHGVTYDEICNALKNKNLIARKGDKYMVVKGSFSNEEAIDAIEKELRILAKLPEKEEITEYRDGDYPAGADNDPNAPWNQEDNDEERIENETLYELIVYNADTAIFKKYKTNEFYLMDLDEVFGNKAAGLEEEDIFQFLNDNEQDLDQYFVPLTVELIDELQELYTLNSFFRKRLEQIKAGMGGLNENGVNWADNYKELDPKPKLRTNPENQAILDKVRALKQRSDVTHPKPITKNPLDPHPDDIDEMTSAAGGSSGAFTAPMNVKPVRRDIQETNVADAGNFQYDAPGLVGISRDGKFSKNKKKTKAQTTPQWAGGSFVEQPECSKLNNNKEAQNGGCNSGASSLKTKKSSGSVNAPSLAENSLYEEVAKQTGRTIEEVKSIIESKKQ